MCPTRWRSSRCPRPSARLPPRSDLHSSHLRPADEGGGPGVRWRDALIAAGCDQLFVDKLAGGLAVGSSAQGCTRTERVESKWIPWASFLRTENKSQNSLLTWGFEGSRLSDSNRRPAHYEPTPRKACGLRKYRLATSAGHD